MAKWTKFVLYQKKGTHGGMYMKGSDGKMHRVE
jgi:hypothetical protein